MIALATEHLNAEGLLKRALTRRRELFLAQSSDWPFIMNSGTMVEYARTASQTTCSTAALWPPDRAGAVDEAWLSRLEERDNLFPHLDYRLFQSLETTVPREVSGVTAFRFVTEASAQ